MLALIRGGGGEFSELVFKGVTCHGGQSFRPGKLVSPSAGYWELPYPRLKTRGGSSSSRGKGGRIHSSRGKALGKGLAAGGGFGSERVRDQLLGKQTGHTSFEKAFSVQGKERAVRASSGGEYS